MPTGNTPNLDMPYIEAAQNQKHIPHNEALFSLDALVQLTVISASLSSPPVSPGEGDRYIPTGTPTGAWAGLAGKVVGYYDGAWQSWTPKVGWTAYDQDSGILLAYTVTGWKNAAEAGFSNLGKLGINTTADNTNRLAVKSDAILLSHDDVTPGTGDLRITVNKSAAGKDAGFTFQDGFSTRALFGLLGDDNFTIKVSPDGSAFHQGMSIDKSTGHVGLNGFTADANNGLGVKGTAFLFDAETDDCRFTFNKVASGDDVALTFQSGYSARALVGLLGDDNFTFKVSPDGSTYHSAMVIDKDDGAVDFPVGAKFSAWCNFGQNYTAGAWQDLFANNTRHNDQGAFASVSNVGVFTAPVAGYYVFGLGATYESPGGSAPTKMQIGLSVNNATPTSDTINTAGDRTITSLGTSCVTTACLKLAAGDTVKGKIFFTTNNGRVAADLNHFWGARIA